MSPSLFQPPCSFVSEEVFLTSSTASASALALFPGASHFLLVGKDAASGPNLTDLATPTSQAVAESLPSVAALMERSSGGQFMYQEGLRPLAEDFGVGMAAPLLSGIGMSAGAATVRTLEVLPAPHGGIRSGVRLSCSAAAVARKVHHPRAEGAGLHATRFLVEYLQADLLTAEGCRSTLVGPAAPPAQCPLYPSVLRTVAPPHLYWCLFSRSPLLSSPLERTVAHIQKITQLNPPPSRRRRPPSYRGRWP